MCVCVCVCVFIYLYYRLMHSVHFTYMYTRIVTGVCNNVHHVSCLLISLSMLVKHDLLYKHSVFSLPAVIVHHVILLLLLLLLLFLLLLLLLLLLRLLLFLLLLLLRPKSCYLVSLMYKRSSARLRCVEMSTVSSMTSWSCFVSEGSHPTQTTCSWETMWTEATILWRLFLF